MKSSNLLGNDSRSSSEDDNNTNEDSSLAPNTPHPVMPLSLHHAGIPVTTTVGCATPHDCTRVVVMSDTHGQHRRVALPRCGASVLIHAGDLTLRGEPGTLMDLAQYFSMVLHCQQ